MDDSGYSAILRKSSKSHHLGTLLLLLFWLGVAGTVYANQQRIIDWWKLRGYTPPAAVATLATEDTMTEYARHLFYVNKPVLVAGGAFTASCPVGGEKTVVLGCYKSGDSGIWLYDVTDARLTGVEQVTAAHEMLHAAYMRLSRAERTRIDGLLQDYYKHGLSDSRVKLTIAAYQKTEPDAIANEMHSIFATEVAELPASLETYYSRYFSNRAAVTAFTQRYQGEFTSRQDQVKAYDAQLAVLKSSIESGQSTLQSQRASIDAQMSQMEQLKSNREYTAYNAQVPVYNQLVNSYNRLLTTTRDQIAEYNEIVEKRNATALEERQLVQALSPSSLPSAR